MTGFVGLKDGVLLRYVATDTEQQQILDLLASIRARFDSAEDPAFVRAAGRLAQQLPSGVREFLVSARTEENASAYIVSAPMLVPDRLGPTPIRWGVEPQPKATGSFEMALVIFASLLGDVFAWRTQQEGRLVHDVLPVKGLEFEQLGAGSVTPLSWHTEDAFHEYRGDYVGLACLRNPDRVATTIASSDSLDLTSEMKATLRKPSFMIKPDNSHLPKHNLGVSSEHFEQIENMFTAPSSVPLLFGDTLRGFLRIDPDFMQVAEGDKEASAALVAISSAIDNALADIVLERGDFFFIDNYRCVHGRRSFQPRFDGHDRWLKRVNVSRNIRHALAMGACNSARVMA